MANFSEFLANELLDNTLKALSYTGPGLLYLGLFNTNPGLETNNQTGEVTGTNYERTLVAFDAATGSQAVNTADVVFPTAGAGGWGTIQFAAVMTLQTGGNVLYWSALDANKTIASGDTFKFLQGAYVVQHQ